MSLAEPKRAVLGAHVPLPAQIPSLTSLRFFAAFWVLVLHLALFVNIPVIGGSTLLENGDLGVDLFFILSGFILTHVYAEAALTGRFRALTFVWNRIARIYPAYLVTTAAMVALSLVATALDAAHGDLLWGRYVAATLLMVQSWGLFDIVMLNGPSWSVSAEWFAYLSFPVLLGLILTGFRRPILFFLAALGVLLCVTLALPGAGLGDMTNQITRLPILRIMPEFVYGCALYALARKHTLTLAAARLGLVLTLALLLPLAALTQIDAILIPLLGAVIFFIAQQARHDDRGALAHPALVYLGETSYALYLAHWPVFFVLFSIPAGLQGLPEFGSFSLSYGWIGLLASLVAAIALHHGIERPARNLMRAIGPPAIFRSRRA